MTFALDELFGPRTILSRPPDVEITKYVPGMETAIEKDLHWCLSNLLYLSFLYLPALARSWWRDDCPRWRQAPIETWVTKWVSEVSEHVGIS